MQIRLLKGIQFDINDVPENLEKLVQRAFTEFTEETAKDYTFEDKLLFIDKTVQKLHGDRDPSYIANDLCMTKFKLDLAWHKQTRVREDHEDPHSSHHRGDTVGTAGGIR